MPPSLGPQVSNAALSPALWGNPSGSSVAWPGGSSRLPQAWALPPRTPCSFCLRAFAWAVPAARNAFPTRLSGEVLSCLRASIHVGYRPLERLLRVDKQEKWSSSRRPFPLWPISDSRLGLTLDQRLILNHDPWPSSRVTCDHRLTRDPNLTPCSDLGPQPD